MTAYFVESNFEAFQREYKRGAILSDTDLECWLPEVARAVKLMSLAAEGAISLASSAAEQAAQLAKQHAVEAEKALADAQAVAVKAEADAATAEAAVQA